MPHRQKQIRNYTIAIVCVVAFVLLAVCGVAFSDLNGQTQTIVITALVGFGGTICTQIFGQITATQRTGETQQQLAENTSALAKGQEKMIGKADEAARLAKEAKERAADAAQVTGEIRSVQKEIKQKVDGNLKDAMEKTAEEVRKSERDQVIADLLNDPRFRQLVRYIVDETCSAIKAANEAGKR